MEAEKEPAGLVNPRARIVHRTADEGTHEVTKQPVLGLISTVLARFPAALALQRRGQVDRCPSTDIERVEMLSLFFGFCVASVLLKGYIARFNLADPAISPHVYNGEVLHFLGGVLACCLEDVVVGLACLLAGLAALRLSRPGWSRRMVRILAHFAAVAALLYLAGNVKLFNIRREFLRFDLFRMGGGFTPLPCVLESVSSRVKLGIVLVPLMTMMAHFGLVQAVLRQCAGATRFVCRPIVLGSLTVGLAVLAPPLRLAVCGDCYCDFGRNPHLIFLSSIVWNPSPFEEGEEINAAEIYPDRRGYSGRLLSVPPKNVIVIVSESLGTQCVQTYGCSLPTTPNLRRLAGRSLTFDNCYSSTNYSLGAAMPLFSGVYGNPTSLSTFEKNPAFQAPLALRHMQGLGYRTYFFGDGGRNVWEVHFDMVSRFCTDGCNVARDPRAPFWRKAPRPAAFLDDEYWEEQMFADVRRAVREEGSNRFAMLLWPHGTHFPYHRGPGPDDWAVEHMPPMVRGNAEWQVYHRRYLRAVWRLDKLVGELYDTLEAQGRAEDTLVVLTGDHGESWGEHSQLTHGSSLYEQQTHVPLILINPRLARLGTRNRVVGSHVDLWPTITDICSLPFHPHWQGRSLVSGGVDDRHAFFYGSNGKQFGMREGRWKYFRDGRRGQNMNGHFLFDIEADPGELKNLKDVYPDRTREMSRRVTAWVIHQKHLTGQQP